MTSNIVIQHYVNGTSRQFVRRIKQGRHKAIEELKRTETIVIHVTKLEKENFIKMQSKSGFSQSFYGNIILSLGLMQLSESDNCSKQ